jgi:fatty-acyl-CoA synthase
MAGYAEWAFVYFALARNGAIMVPVNTRYRPDEIKYALNRSKASLLVFKEEPNKDFVGLLKQLFPGGAFAGTLPNETLPSLRALIAASDRCIDGCLGFDELIAAGKAVSQEESFQAASEVTGGNIALIQFTSGTTAMPKGALLFHAAMLRGAYCGCEVLQLSEADRFFSPSRSFMSAAPFK